jgi:hypothetical protein
MFDVYFSNFILSKIRWSYVPGKSHHPTSRQERCLRWDLSYNCKQSMLVTFCPSKCTTNSDTPVFGQNCLNNFLLSTGNWTWKFLAKYETKWRSIPPWETTTTWTGLSVWSQSDGLLISWQRSFSNTGCSIFLLFDRGNDVGRCFRSGDDRLLFRASFKWLDLSELGSLRLGFRKPPVKSTFEGFSECCLCKDESFLSTFERSDFFKWLTSRNNEVKKSTARFWTCVSVSAPCGSLPDDNVFLSSGCDLPSASP